MFSPQASASATSVEHRSHPAVARVVECVDDQAIAPDLDRAEREVWQSGFAAIPGQRNPRSERRVQHDGPGGWVAGIRTR